MFAAAAGLATGLVHVLAGPDHLAAVAPLAADSTRTHWKAGFQWGLGHTAGVLMIGAMLLVFREVLPVAAISDFSERIVGLALIGVGLWAGVRARRLHVHRHDDGSIHAHVKGPNAALEPARHAAQHHSPRLHGHIRTHASFLMGTLHGLAGSSHLFGVLPALALPTYYDAALYLGGFGLGAVVAMSAFAALVGIAAAGAGRRSLATYRGVLYACSFSACVVGAFWLVA